MIKLNKLHTMGLDEDYYTLVQCWNNKANGNGLYLVSYKDGGSNTHYRLIQVHSNGYLTDNIIVYSRDTYTNKIRFATDTGYVNKSSRRAIETAIRFAEKQDIYL